MGKVPGAANSVSNDFPDASATSESLCDIQDSFWEESEARGKQISDFTIFGARPREAVPWRYRWRVGQVTAAAKIMPNDFSDDCATSESLCYTQGSIPEEFWGRASRFLTFVIFGPPPAPGCTAKGAWDCLLSIAGGGEGARSREQRIKRFS